MLDHNVSMREAEKECEKRGGAKGLQHNQIFSKWTLYIANVGTQIEKNEKYVNICVHHFQWLDVCSKITNHVLIYASINTQSSAIRTIRMQCNYSVPLFVWLIWAPPWHCLYTAAFVQFKRCNIFCSLKDTNKQ